ncbi:ABC transporter ATP-binding protein [Cytobacillus purgationiresistens]|uniref:ABC-2 type transport system ATP-binding protein n=1 Tax=Cytobacillus purgationiresistens TaxID=863449 RepID=A0ABU0AQY3_9BACI|nr:ABC transporter ATP-binding protein [Cytobacillus purgationiresistens]MDQ0273701.1 ABC-2 type transport system ATP-binding protein [Cytobacillus purgationiresistens]
MTVISVEGLKKNFKNLEVIKGIDFDLPEQKVVALLGANGAGKTTVLKTISGLIKPTSGTIHFNDENDKDVRHWIGYLPQFPVFYNWMTGKEFLLYVGRLSGLTKHDAKQRTEELLSLVGMTEAKNRRIGKYSGGMKQRLGIAQALIHQPKLLILDEPVSALDPLGRREVIDLLKKLKNEMTVLFSTHILSDAEEVSDEILFLHDGVIVESGAMNELTAKYKQPKITLVFERNIEEYIEEIKSQTVFQSVEINSNEAVLLTDDMEGAKKVILQEASRNNWPLTKFEMSSTKLEEMFIKVVQGK